MLGVAVGSAVPAPAQAPADAAAKTPSWPPREIGKLTVSAQPLEKPDLTFALLPRAEDTTKGNAAVKYMAAAAELPQLSAAESALLDAALGARLDALPENDPDLTAVLAKYQSAMNLLREGSRIEGVDWQTHIREQGISALLPSLGKFRQLANPLAVQIRLDIRHHAWTAARDKLQTGYALARHLDQGDTLIESLVGIAIASRLNNCLEDWVSQPESPNLYWPLSNLPAPFNNLRHPMSYERAFAYFSLPDFKKMHDGQYSPDIWNNAVAEFTNIAGQPPTARWQIRLAGPALGLMMYPEARRFLVERGLSAAAVERMPVAEALGRYFVRSFEEQEDDVFKWMGLPPGQAVPGLKAWEAQFQRDRAAKKVNMLAAILLPSLSRALETSMKVDRQVAMLRLVEALRAYAAEQGQFPDSLDALKLPVPADPSGRPFAYERNGATATLTAAALDTRDMVRYEVTLRK